MPKDAGASDIASYNGVIESLAGIKGRRVRITSWRDSLATTTRSNIVWPNPKRIWLTIENISADVAYIGIGDVDPSSNGIHLNQYGVLTLDKLTPWWGILRGESAGASTVAITECEVDGECQ